MEGKCTYYCKKKGNYYVGNWMNGERRVEQLDDYNLRLFNSFERKEFLDLGFYSIYSNRSFFNLVLILFFCSDDYSKDIFKERDVSHSSKLLLAPFSG